MSEHIRKDISRRSYADMISVISRTLAAANRTITKLLTNEGIDNLVPSHGDILMQLFSHKELSMAALADAIGKDPSTVTTLVKKLADAGYVQTKKDDQDKRITNVTLSKKGQDLESKVMNISNKLLTTITKGISDECLNKTRQTLLDMKGNFEKGLETR